MPVIAIVGDDTVIVCKGLQYIPLQVFLFNRYSISKSLDLQRVFNASYEVAKDAHFTSHLV